MKDKVYIASGFFTPEALNKVIATEEGLGKEGIDFFSPRTVTADLSPNNPDREKNAKMLFDKDLEEIHNCNKMHAILDDTMDIGTLFEIGYFFGLYIRDHENRSLNNLEIESNFDQDVEVMNFIKELDNQSFVEFLINDYERGFDPLELDPIFVTNGAAVTEFMLKVVGQIGYSYDQINSVLLKVADNYTPIFVTDDRPWQIFVLMGAFHALHIPFLTASTMNYGSNIMIASSSLGHINLPSIVNPYKTKVNIE